MLQTYEIKSGRWKAQVAPLLGANVIKLECDGQAVFKPLESQKQLEASPYIQGAPLLLPANRTAEGRFSFEGRDYTLEITEPATGANLHGLLHRQAFAVIESREDKIVLFYKNGSEIYPFPFEITATYSFEEDKFLQRFDIKNTGEGNMPLTFALHTSFVEPESFSVPIDACQTKNEKHIPVGGYFPLNAQEKRYVTGSASKDVAVSGYYRACGREAKVGDFIYRASEKFDHWILFNGSGKKGLLCVEPQCGAVNGLNTENGKTVLEAGQVLSLWTELEKAD